MWRSLPSWLLVLTACERAPVRHDLPLSRDSADSVFNLVQARGQTAMGVDQYTSMHRFEAFPDGGRITLQRDPGDTAGVARIRAHMRLIAAVFSRGNFDLPGFVHDREVPGASAMAARRSHISYVADTLPGGGEVRLITTDPTALAAIHEFLAFQRHDHRAGNGASH
jgi:hypothetical protein